MKQITVRVICPTGVREYQSAVVVSVAKKFNCEIRITFEGRNVDMKSIMGVMSLGITAQSEVIITCNGDDEEAAITVIEDVLNTQKIIELSDGIKEVEYKCDYFLKKLKNIIKKG